MLMESRVQDSHDAANAKKPRSLDLQTLYDQNPGLSVDKKQNQTGALKRKRGNDDSGLAKKSKKELSLCSVPYGRKIKKSLGEVYKGGSSSVTGALNQTESGQSQKSDDKANGFDGISLNIGDDILQIPKRRRDLARRKKADVSNRLKHEGILGGKVSSSDAAAALNVVSKGKRGQDGEINGKPDQNGNSKGSFSIDVAKRVKRKKGFDEQKESRSSELDLLELLKKENGNSHAHTGDPNKKVRRNRKKKEMGIEIDDAVKDVKPVLDQTARVHDKSIDDDQENLEANAARMLSSRFDPSCTGFSYDTRSSNAPSIVPSCRDDADHGSNLLESDVASDDKDARVLRPRDQGIKKGVFRKRRHFYEVLSKDIDAYWMVKRKIKVYWPLDQIWYFGKVIGYDPKRMLHHIKYDDREEEWIDLRNERLKLLMFPSELPLKAGRRASRTKAKYDVKVKPDAKLQDGYPTSSRMDGEPIISWLAGSTGRMKSSPLSDSKKQKTFEQSGKASPSSSAPVKGTASESLDIRSAQNSADKPLSNPGLSDSSYSQEVAKTSTVESSSRYPVVYFRRRFRRKESANRMGNFHEEQLVHSRINCPDSVNKLGHFPQEHLVYGTVSGSVDSLVLPNRSHPSELCRVERPHFDDDLVILNLSVPVTNTRIFRFKLNFLPFLVPHYSFGVENLRLIHAVLMLQHGTLMCLRPRVHLEMFFVDNFVGLRLILFEGCLVEAIAFVFSILNVFHQSNQQRAHVEEQLPVTSIWFQFSCIEDVTKQLVFALHNFCGLKTSRWVFLDRMLQKHCFLAKQLPPSECNYDNIQALKNGLNHLILPSVSLEPSSRSRLRKTTRQPVIGASASVNHSQSRVNSEGKSERLPSFARSFSAAPTLALSLQLKLLMECSTPRVNFKDCNSISAPENGVEHGNCCPGECNCNSNLHFGRTILGNTSSNGFNFEQPSWSNTDIGNNGASAGCEDAEITPEASQNSRCLDDDCLNNRIEMKCDQRHSSAQSQSQSQSSCPKDQCSELEAKTAYCPLNGITVENPLFDLQERPSSGELHNAVSSELPTKVTDGGIHSPISTASRNSWRMRKAGSSLLGNSSGGKPDLLRSGPKKPRTQVSYSVPLEGHDFSMKYGSHHTKGFSHKRIRRATKKNQSDVSRDYLRDTDSLSCDVNVLVSKEDRGWREEGAKVVLELVDDSQWRLAVKILGCTWYAYKAPQFFQSGTTNRYTHAMMWKGGKHWTLEFPDRSQWTLFKEMHEECYDRNFRAASVKNIPIPGVRLIEENEDSGAEIPFVRSSPRYIRQLQTDVDIAMDPSHVIYDMDSDDESWISKIRSSDVGISEMGDIPDEMFEKIMDTLEKVAYDKQQDHFTSDELEELIVEGVPVEAIKLFYEHWLEKRQKRGIPLLRHLQPPRWEKYQQQVKELESAMYKSNGTVSTGCHGKAIEKPPLYAFCMKPRGLVLANNRGTKHRSHKKHPVTGHGNLFLGDPESFHIFGRRFNGCATGEEKILYQHGYMDSPVRLSSPRDVGGQGYMSLNNEGYEGIHYPRLHRTKSRKIATLVSPNDRHGVAPNGQRFMSKRNGMQSWNAHLPEWASPRYFHPDGPQRLSFKNLNPSDLDEFRLRDASGAAQHAVTMAKLKRENAQRLLYKADLAIHKAVVALMTADAIKASREEPINDASSEG